MTRVLCLLLVVLGSVELGGCASPSAQAGEPTQRAQARLRIAGMACDSCAERLAKKLRDVEGVLDVEVVFAEKRATIDYDTKRLSVPQLVEAVEDLGFDATPDQS